MIFQLPCLHLYNGTLFIFYAFALKLLFLANFISTNIIIHHNPFRLLIHNYIFNPIIKTILFVIFCLHLEARLILTLDYRIFFSF